MVACSDIERRGKRAKVLVVDDSGLARKMLRMILDGIGHEVIEAKSAAEGLEVAAKEKPDCITSDLLMPGMTGLDFLEAMREQKIRIPVIVMTADIQQDTKDQCMKLGAIAFLNKPPTKESLEEAVGKATKAMV